MEQMPMAGQAQELSPDEMWDIVVEMMESQREDIIIKSESLGKNVKGAVLKVFKDTATVSYPSGDGEHHTVKIVPIKDILEWQKQTVE